jgi:hypothetical protein
MHKLKLTVFTTAMPPCSVAVADDLEMAKVAAWPRYSAQCAHKQCKMQHSRTGRGMFRPTKYHS